MRAIFPVLIALAILSQNARAQNHLSVGYIVKLNGDTIKGFIHDRTDKELGLAVEFRKEKDASSVKFSPADLKGFGFDYGRKFKRFSIDSRETRSNDTLVFAKWIIEGKVGLYIFDRPKANEPDMFLINNQSQRLVHLTEPEKEEIIYSNGQKLIRESSRFIGLLKIIKDDSSKQIGKAEKIRYHEKSIEKSIIEYDNSFSTDFPITKYKPRITYLHAITAGLPVINRPEGTDFRVAFYRHKYFPERSGAFSIIQGISYRYGYSDEPFDSNVKNSNLNYRQQFLSVIPIGVCFQSSSGFVRPYCYFGVGLGLMVNNNRHIVDYVDNGNKTEMIVFPALNFGVGIKIKAGSDFVLIESTTTGNRSGIFLNLGYSF